MGYEIREKRLILDEKNKHTFHAGMVFCLRFGLQNLELKHIKGPSHVYALLIADTLIVTDSGAECITPMGKKHSKVRLSLRLHDRRRFTCLNRKLSSSDYASSPRSRYGYVCEPQYLRGCVDAAPGTVQMYQCKNRHPRMPSQRTFLNFFSCASISTCKDTKLCPLLFSGDLMPMALVSLCTLLCWLVNETCVHL